jgi:hypothetical protein
VRRRSMLFPLPADRLRAIRPSRSRMIASSLQMRLVIIATNGPVDDLQAADDQLIAATVIEQPRCHFAAVKAAPPWPDSGDVGHLMQDVAARMRILALDHCPSIVTVLNCPRPRAGLSVRYRRLKPSSLQEASLRQIAATQISLHCRSPNARRNAGGYRNSRRARIRSTHATFTDKKSTSTIIYFPRFEFDSGSS